MSAEHSLNALDLLFKTDVDPSRVAGILIEPVQSDGGFNIAPFEFLRALRALCDPHEILLIVDEIQTGFARTGRMFAIEHAGVDPAGIDQAVVQRSAEREPIVPSCGGYSNVIRFLVAPAAPDAIVSEGMDKLESALIEAVAP